jgi:hypothetical protein
VGFTSFFWGFIGPDDDTEVIESSFAIEAGIDPAADEFFLGEMSTGFMVMDGGIFEEDMVVIIADGDDIMTISEAIIFLFIAPGLDGTDHRDFGIQAAEQIFQGKMFLGSGIEAEVTCYSNDIFVTCATFIRAEDGDEIVFLIRSDAEVLADRAEGCRSTIIFVALFDFREMN